MYIRNRIELHTWKRRLSIIREAISHGVRKTSGSPEGRSPLFGPPLVIISLSNNVGQRSPKKSGERLSEARGN
ncbi:hypothetical protein RRG08_050014 [Elysia crispata]|uniref:Uncharacterized protein n=1 Tax=Elysia crispata TaxID=231223 RepID=A0AAE1EC62_9GAST|nr:hypothetical protein RRG08_050014 [Elysia crispata]